MKLGASMIGRFSLQTTLAIAIFYPKVYSRVFKMQNSSMSARDEARQNTNNATDRDCASSRRRQVSSTARKLYGIADIRTPGPSNGRW